MQFIVFISAVLPAVLAFALLEFRATNLFKATSQSEAEASIPSGGGGGKFGGEGFMTFHSFLFTGSPS